MENLKDHVHNGTDASKLYAGDALQNAPQEPLTDPDTNTAGATYTAIERAIINNLQTRLNELESKLQTLGIIK